jgi:hypothetical protein
VLRLVVLEAFAFVACVASLAEIRGIAFYYLVLWTRPIAMLCAALPVIAVTRRYWSAREESPLRRVVLRALAVSAVTVPIAICALRAEVPTPYWSRVHREVVARAIEAVPPKTTVRVVSIGPFYQGSAETIAVALERKGRFPKLMPWYSTAVGGHRTVGPRTNLPTLVLATGIGIERVPHRETARVLYERDPYSAEKRAETIELRKHLEAQFVVGGRRDLVDPLDSGVPWLWLVLPSSVDRHDFDRYTDLVVGDAKVPVVLYQLRPTTW